MYMYIYIYISVCVYIHIYIYIYIYIYTHISTKILDFGGLDSSRISSLRGGILMSRGNFRKVSSQQILILAGRLGVDRSLR